MSDIGFEIVGKKRFHVKSKTLNPSCQILEKRERLLVHYYPCPIQFNLFKLLSLF